MQKWIEIIDVNNPVKNAKITPIIFKIVLDAFINGMRAKLNNREIIPNIRNGYPTFLYLFIVIFIYTNIQN